MVFRSYNIVYNVVTVFSLSTIILFSTYFYCLVQKEKRKERVQEICFKKKGPLVCVHKVRHSIRIILGGSSGWKEGLPSQKRQIRHQ